MKRNKIGALTVVPALSLVLAACSSTETTTQTEPTSTPSTSETVTPQPSVTEVPNEEENPIDGGDPSTWAPLVITPTDGGREIIAEVGQAMLFEGFNDDGTMSLFVQSEDPMVVAATQGETIGGVQMAAGARAVAPGETSVSLWTGDPSVENAIQLVAVNVTVAGDLPIIGGNPGTWSPVMLTPNDNGEIVEVVAGQVMLFDDFPGQPNDYTVSSDTPSVVMPMPGSQDGDMVSMAGARAVTAGESQVIVWEGAPMDGTPVAQYTVMVSAYEPAVESIQDSR